MKKEAAKAGNGRELVWLMAALAMPLPWLQAAVRDGAGLSHEVVAPLAGVAIVGAAFLLSWAVELAERDIPQSLAILVLALISVLPEYAVDLHFAILAATDPSHAHYAVANMTGANRLLIGLGWAAVVLLACFRDHTTHMVIPATQRLEMRFLLLSTLYSFLIPLNGSIDLVDAAVLIGIFLWYVAAATQGHREESELVGPAAWIEARVSDGPRRLIAGAFLVYAAVAICEAAARPGTEPQAAGEGSAGRARHNCASSSSNCAYRGPRVTTSTTSWTTARSVACRSRRNCARASSPAA